MRENIFALALVLCLAAAAAGQERDKKERVVVEPDQNYLVLSTKRIQTMEKELDEAAAKGFRVLYGAPTESFDMAILLTRVQDAAQAPYGYKILATTRLKTMEKELNEFAAQGYRLLPRTAVFKQGFLTAELVMLVERDPRSGKVYEYDLVTATKETKLHRKIEESIARGFAPMTMITLGEHVIVMEREKQSAAQEPAAAR